MSSDSYVLGWRYLHLLLVPVRVIEHIDETTPQRRAADVKRYSRRNDGLMHVLVVDDDVWIRALLEVLRPSCMGVLRLLATTLGPRPFGPCELLRQNCTRIGFAQMPWHNSTGAEFLMPLPRSVARFNRRVTNRVLGPLAPHLPGFGVVIHRGRRSGRSYRTPVNVFGRPGGVVVALTYGPSADWVRNVLANDGCTLEMRGRRLRLRSPRLIHDESARSVPPMLRPVGRIGHVVDFLDLSLATPPRPMVPWWVGVFNVVARRALAAGLPMGPNALLSVPGRKSGVPRTTPVSIVDDADRCWVIGVFGDVDWVRNLRAAGHARVGRRGRTQTVTARELAPAEAFDFFREVFAPMVRH